MSSQPLLHMEHIHKSFPGVLALKDVQLTIDSGEILALLGENGAGKSTLMKILNGVYQADAGSILWQGHPVAIHSPSHAQHLGISMIHQELALIPYLDAAKNIYLGREPHGVIPGTIDWKRMYADAETLLRDIGLDIPVNVPVRWLSIAQQQMIEVAKALSMNARLIVMDEPTSSLTDREVEKLFEQMRQLKSRGVAIIFISHRLEEVFSVCDRVTVLRDGEYIDSQPVHTITVDNIIQMMVGREVGQIYEKREQKPASDVILEVRNLTRGTVVQDVSFKLHKGEILGIAGLVGAGRTELVETIFGVHPASSGDIYIEGQPVHIRYPSHAIKAGIGLVPEDRKKQGLFLGMSVAMNIAMVKLRRLVNFILIRWGQVADVSREYIDRMNIRTPSAQQRVRNLSGGNQQKVVISRWLTLNPRVLILDEPTRGIDVGAKSEIYRLMNRLAERGVGMLVISSELPEVMGISDRILVMREGRLVGEFNAEGVTQDQLMQAAIGAKGNGK